MKPTCLQKGGRAERIRLPPNRPGSIRSLLSPLNQCARRVRNPVSRFIRPGSGRHAHNCRRKLAKAAINGLTNSSANSESVPAYKCSRCAASSHGQSHRVERCSSSGGSIHSELCHDQQSAYRPHGRLCRSSGTEELTFEARPSFIQLQRQLVAGARRTNRHGALRPGGESFAMVCTRAAASSIAAIQNIWPFGLTPAF